MWLIPEYRPLVDHSRGYRVSFHCPSPGHPVSLAGPPQPGGILQLIQQDDTSEPRRLLRPGAPHPDPGGLEGRRRRGEGRKRRREGLWSRWRDSECGGFQTTYRGASLPSAAVARWGRRSYRAGNGTTEEMTSLTTSSTHFDTLVSDLPTSNRCPFCSLCCHIFFLSADTSSPSWRPYRRPPASLTRPHPKPRRPTTAAASWAAIGSAPEPRGGSSGVTSRSRRSGSAGQSATNQPVRWRLEHLWTRSSVRTGSWLRRGGRKWEWRR